MTLKRSPMKRGKVNATSRADVLFSRLVRDRDHHCLRCGEVNNLQAAHIWSRRYRALRWRFENCITLCQGCHLYFTLRPAEWAEWCEGREFCQRGIHFVSGGVQMHHTGDCGSATYERLRWRALNDPPEKAVDALKRLRGADV